MVNLIGRLSLLGCGSNAGESEGARKPWVSTDDIDGDQVSSSQSDTTTVVLSHFRWMGKPPINNYLSKWLT